jgi:hypothetical protein
MMKTSAVQAGVEALLELAGVSETAAMLVSAEMAALVDWVESELAGGRDPQAQLQALMTTAESAAKATELELFGPPK